MRQILDLDLQRLLRLPGGDDTWQLAVVRSPQWVKEKDEAPFRPRMAICRSAATGRVGFSGLFEMPAEEEGAACKAICSLSRVRDVQARPGRIEVRDPRLAAALRNLLSDPGIQIEVAESLPLVDEVYQDMVEQMAGPSGGTSLLGGPGVDEARARAFAEAGAAFHRAAPWNHLTDEDLIRVASPVPDAGMKWLTVLGAAGITRGIGFHRSQRDHLRMATGEMEPQALLATPRWLLCFEPAFSLSVPDAELWEKRGFPLAAEEAHPLLYCHVRSGMGPAPDASRLTFVEGLMRALAGTSEDEMDQGRWSKTIATFDGERVVTLEIPALLEPRPSVRRAAGRAAPLGDRRLLERTLLDIQQLIAQREFASPEEANEFLASLRGKAPPHATPATPAARAQDMFYEALEARGRTRIRRAREALRVHPDCVDARVLLAEEMPDLARRTELYREAMETAERVLGAEPFATQVGHFWGILETRPYVRARAGLADCLWKTGEREAATEHWHELLGLNPNDGLGLRFLLVPALIEMGCDAGAAAVLSAYDEDPSAILGYARALLAFRGEGDRATSQRQLAAAIRSNPHVVKYLVGSADMPDELPSRCSFGSEEEAVLAAAELREAWRGTAGAVEWLRAARRSAKKERDRKRRGKRC